MSLKDLPYFLIGLASEKLKQSGNAATREVRNDRVLAQYAVSNADQIAGAMASAVVTQPEPEQFDAILLLAHGTPDVLGEMDEYLKLVTGGRGVPPHVVHELQERYAEIGLKDEPTARGHT